MVLSLLATNETDNFVMFYLKSLFHLTMVAAYTRKIFTIYILKGNVMTNFLVRLAINSLNSLKPKFLLELCI